MTNLLVLTPYMLFLAAGLSLITATIIAMKRWIIPFIRRGHALMELAEAQLQPSEGNGGDIPPSLITKIDHIGVDTAEVKNVLTEHLKHSIQQDELLEATVGRVERLESG